MNKKTMLVALLGAFLGLSTAAFAGPGPGKYKGKLKRTATGLENKSWTAVVKANNPTDANAPFSTHVESNSKSGTTESLSYAFDVMPDGNVHANIRSKIKIGDSVYQVSVNGQAMGEFTEHSFQTRIPKANVSVQKVGSKKVKSGLTKLSIFAGSPSTGKIEVTIVAESSTVLPLKYKASYKGELVP